MALTTGMQTHQIERNRDIAIKYIQGATGPQLAQEYGVTIERVRQITYKFVRLADKDFYVYMQAKGNVEHKRNSECLKVMRKHPDRLTASIYNYATRILQRSKIKEEKW